MTRFVYLNDDYKTTTKEQKKINVRTLDLDPPPSYPHMHLEKEQTRFLICLI